MLSLRRRVNSSVFVCLIALLCAGFLTVGNSVQAGAVEPITVCSDGCDFVTIQDAVDNKATKPGDVILVDDPMHTEGGISIYKDIVIQGHGAKNTIVQAARSLEAARERVFIIP